MDEDSNMHVDSDDEGADEDTYKALTGGNSSRSEAESSKMFQNDVDSTIVDEANDQSNLDGEALIENVPLTEAEFQKQKWAQFAFIPQ